MNIEALSAVRECTSCQVCAAICPKDAISIFLDVDGFYRPCVDNVKCIDCGLCVSVCYKFDESIDAYCDDDLNKTTLYGASAKESNILTHTTSGGIADILARELISEGYKCIGVVYDSVSDIAKDVVATSYKDIESFRGSKYIQSYTFPAFRELVRSVGLDKYAVFGTPCHIYALDRFLRKRNVRDSFFLIDLYCHGCPSINIWKKYIKSIKKSTCYSEIEDVNFRSKKRGWGNFCVAAMVNNNVVFTSSNRNNAFYDLFFSDQLLNSACNDCLLRSTLAYTDIRLGDFWGKRYILNSEGVSAVSVVTERARLLFSKIQERIVCKEEQYHDFLPWQSWGKNHHPDSEIREILLSQLRDPDVSLSKSVDAYNKSLPIKQRIIRFGKRLIQLLPNSLEKRIRWFYYSL